MINFNGFLRMPAEGFLNHENRGLRYGDALFETIKVVNGKPLFWEDHYLRLMASMRIVRMEIPMSFTMEYLEAQIQKTLVPSYLKKAAARIRITVFRNNGGLYRPQTNEVSYIMEAHPLADESFVLHSYSYEVELFKDFLATPDMLSNLKTNNKMLHIVGSIYAEENGYQNCLLLNTRKNVVEALNGNIFLVNGNKVATPTLNDGCLNGILRKKVMQIVGKSDEFELQERAISPFELQKADELFITNAIVGIQPVTQYRKKNYTVDVAQKLTKALNLLAKNE